MKTSPLRIGIAYDLKSDIAARGADGPRPEDWLEEYESEDTVEAIAAALRAAGHEAVLLGGGRGFLEAVLRETRSGPGLDLVFTLAEGTGSRSREGQVPAVCEMLGIPCTHSDPVTLGIALDKSLAKRIAASHGVPTPAFCVVDSMANLVRAALPPFPVIAKPNGEGSSMGIRAGSRCDGPGELTAAVAALLDTYRQPVLVEALLTGVECTVAILGEGASARVAGIMEIAPRRVPVDRFLYSLEAKRNWREEVDYHVPPRLPAPLVEAFGRTALAACRALGCRDVARVDLRCDGAGVPQLLEVNPLPGLDPVTGDLPIACERSGLPYDRLIAAIVELAMGRGRRA